MIPFLKYSFKLAKQKELESSTTRKFRKSYDTLQFTETKQNFPTDVQF